MNRLCRLTMLVLVCIVLTIISNGLAEDEKGAIDKTDYVELPPYKAENVLYTSFNTYPRTLDPAVAYSSNEYALIGTIYEPPITYHPLKRPYEFVPLTATEVPHFVYKWKETGKDLSRDEVNKLLGETTPCYTDEEIAKIDIYLDVKIKKGIYYAPHPCFAKDEEGNYKYYNLKDEDVKDFNGDLYNLKVNEKDTRELVAADYVYQMKRMCNPANPSQILPNLFDYLQNTYEYYKNLRSDLLTAREEQGNLSDYEMWLKPVQLDFEKHEFEAAEVIDKYTYRIHFSKPYTKFLYWMAMPFFSPMPKEAEEFFYQKPLRKEYFTLSYCPVGTGSYYMRVFNEDRIESWRNPIYRDAKYPSEGESSDKANGYLEDAGKKLPFIDKIVRQRVKNPNQIWEEFLKGRFTLSGISSKNFDKHIKFVDGKPEISQFLKDRNISLRSTVLTSIWYMAFNMLDKDWGGLTEYKCLMRQAVSIALDMEEYNQEFTDGRNISCHSIFPPGIFGYEKPEDVTYIDSIEDLEYYFNIELSNSDKKRSKLSELTEEERVVLSEKYSMFFNTFKDLDESNRKLVKSQLGRTPKDDEILAEVRFGMNWVIYKWDKKLNKPVRRDIAYANKLMKEAGVDKDDKEIDLQFLTMGVSSADIEVAQWRKGQLENIGVKFNTNGYEYSEFQNEAKEGNYDCLEWGWNADYPDPENFLFLLYGPNHKVDIESGSYKGFGGGENAANYGNPEYDKLFKQMENMKDSPQRLRIIRRMINILRHDSPWILSNLSCSYVLYHSWYKNTKTNLMGNDSYKYRRIDVKEWSNYLEKYAGIKSGVIPKGDDDE